SQSAAHSQHTASVQGTATYQGTADIHRTADFQGTDDPHDAASIPKSPNDYTPTDVSHNLERRSDETEEVNIEEKEASNVKSGE
ncbi:hypothetical protein Tco_0614323, partial [Tanacetum coccineum]